MFFRPSRIVRSRICRFLGGVFLLAATWLAWWVWPPQPELQVTIQTTPCGSFGIHSADARWLGLETVIGPAGDPCGSQFDVFELPGGKHCLTLNGIVGKNFWISPHGSRLFYWDEHGQGQVVALPSGEVIRSLPARDPREVKNVQWTPDGRHLLIFDPELSIFRGDTGECVGVFKSIREETYTYGAIFAWEPHGGGFAVLMNDRWALLYHSCDGVVPDTIVPLPGPPANYTGRDGRPADGSVSINKLAVANGGAAIFAFLYRYHRDENGNDRARRYLARWDRLTRGWSEADTGPCTQFGFLGETLRIDGAGKHLVTRNAFHGMICGTGVVRDDWGREEAEKLEGRDLWDATANPPNCLNDDGFPKGLAFLDPTGRRILLKNEENDVHSIYDAETLARLSSAEMVTSDYFDPVFSADGKWLAIAEHLGSPWPSWLPDRFVEFIERFVPRMLSCFRIIRLADGKTVRHLPFDSLPIFTPDGCIWTVKRTDHGGETDTIISERWSPEAPGPPWWLTLFTGGIGFAMAWDLRPRQR
jgi:hypothetical protein